VVVSTADGRAGIDAALVERLIAAQFPQWTGLSVTPVEVDGWDNRTYRLGDRMTVRLPTAAGYVPGVGKESYWLPRLAPSLPVAVPSILAEGTPGEGSAFGVLEVDGQLVSFDNRCLDAAREVREPRQGAAFESE
jgi:aminoglycoside phosphotransferase (APT) family kinase protein